MTNEVEKRKTEAIMLIGQAIIACEEAYKEQLKEAKKDKWEDLNTLYMLRETLTSLNDAYKTLDYGAEAEEST